VDAQPLAEQIEKKLFQGRNKLTLFSNKQKHYHERYIYPQSFWHYLSFRKQTLRGIYARALFGVFLLQRFERSHRRAAIGDLSPVVRVDRHLTGGLRRHATGRVCAAR